MKIVLAFAVLIVIAKANPFEDVRVEEQDELFEPEVEKSTNNLRMLFEKFDKDNNETWVTPDLGRNVSEILPHSTPFINDQFESLDNPSAMDRGKDSTNHSDGHLDSAEDTISGHEGSPRIQVIETRSAKGIPSIAITFANGIKDALVLERFYPTEQSRMEKKVSCNFIGSLENENTACVAVTGCPGEQMAFTIKSKHIENIGYILHQDGQLELVESAFKDSRVTSGTKRVGEGPGGFHSNGDDQMINDDEIAEEVKYSKLCAAGDCSSMPAKQKMQIKIHYDSTFNADTSDVNTYLDQMVTHVQAHFCQISLGTQIAVEAIGGYTYHADQTWKAEPDFGSLGTPIKNIAAADTSGADLGVFMCKDPAFYGVVGLAWVGTMCKGWSGYNAGVNEKRQNVLATSEVVAHEMGHNMGMLHDFDATHGGSGGACDGTGIMSYGSAPNVWSTCSKNDFLALYNSIIASSSKYWCLDVDATACGGTGIQKLFGCTDGSICKVGLKTHHNKYVVAEKKGQANANRAWMRSWEIFSVTFVGADKVQFKGHHGKYLVAERNGKVNANRPWARSWETWTVENKGTGLAFKSYHGKYLVAESNGKLNANRNYASTWETFRVIPV